MDFSSFAREVREAVAHLYDHSYLQHHPIAQLLSDSPEEMSGSDLHLLLIDAIERMRPIDSAPPTSLIWRYYQCLVLRDINGVTAETTARTLGVSPRQARRDHQGAIEALAMILWNSYRAIDAASPRPHAQTGERGAETGIDRAGEKRDDRDNLASTNDSTRTDREDEERFLGAEGRSAPVGLNDAIADALAITGGLANAHGVRFVRGIPPSLPPIFIDRIALRQSLLHLLGYIIHLGRDGRIVSLTTSESADRVNLEIRVPSQPPSIPSGDQPAEEQLAAGRRLLEMHGGILRVSSSGADEIRLTLSLPTKPQIPVLVIDDNPDIASLFRRFLRGRNCLLLHASTGQKALRLAREARPRIILLDLLMPTQDGWDILKLLRAHQETRAIPIVICSILPDRDLALSAGASAFLSKPVSQESLLGIFETFVGVS